MNEDDFKSFGRKPTFSFGKNGPQLRGFRSRPGAPLAEPAQGVMGGSNATSAVDWVSRFKSAGTQMKNAARAELGLDPLDTIPPPGAASPDEAKGEDSIARMGSAGAAPAASIAQQTIDTAFGPGHWAKMIGNPSFGSRPLESINTPAPFMPGQQGTFRGAPKPLTGPLGNKATDLAGLAANRALYEPGGMSGLWSKPAVSGWQTGDSKDIFAKYGDKRKPASFTKFI